MGGGGGGGKTPIKKNHDVICASERLGNIYFFRSLNTFYICINYIQSITYGVAL